MSLALENCSSCQVSSGPFANLPPHDHPQLTRRPRTKLVWITKNSKLWPCIRNRETDSLTHMQICFNIYTMLTAMRDCNTDPVKSWMTCCYQQTQGCLQRHTQLLLLHPFNGLFSRTTLVSRYLKGKPVWI